jgi:glycosyltransferase involved in cell wall biosynthesis
MYRLNKPKKQNFILDTPDFETRLSILKSKKNKKSLVFIKNVFDNSTFRYRAYNMAQAFENFETEYVITYFLNSEIEDILPVINSIDVIILQRTTWCYSIDTLVYLAKNKKIPLIYDIDDLIYSPNYVKEYINCIDANAAFLDDYKDVVFLASNYNIVMNLCDGYITTNDYLARIIHDDFKKPVWVIQNYLNKEQEKISAELVEKKAENFDKSKFIIGYFSGSPSHNTDFRQCSDALLHIMSTYEDVYLKIVGFMNLPSSFSLLKKRIISTPLVDYSNLQIEIAEVDLNIIPLDKNQFTNCKSELKYFEASILKVPSIATDTYIYQKCIQHEFNGLLVKDNANWKESIERVYLDRAFSENLASEALKYCIEKYSNSNQVKKISSVFDEIIAEFAKQKNIVV